MKPAVGGPAATQSLKEECAKEGDPAQALSGKFVEEVIQALIELDAEHLEALAAAAERFRKDSALRMSPDEIREMEAKMRVFSAFLQETRRNLRIMGLNLSDSGQIGYDPGRGRWAD